MIAWRTSQNSTESYGICPDCRRRIWVESGCLAECDSCGWSEGENKDEGKVDEPDTLALGLSEWDFR